MATVHGGMMSTPGQQCGQILPNSQPGPSRTAATFNPSRHAHATQPCSPVLQIRGMDGDGHGPSVAAVGGIKVLFELGVHVAARARLAV